VASHPISSNEFIEDYNTSVMIDSGEFSFIHKSKLVPGVEKIPFASTFPFLEEMSIDLGGTTGTLGIEEEPKVFKSKDLVIAPVVCYESVFGEFISQQCRKGAELICIITNDGWWHDTPGYKQHASFASLRAIENRRSIVRAANTGISCFVDQKGIISQATEWWVPAVIAGTVNKNNELSFYSKFGDFLGRSLSFVAVMLILLSLVRKFKATFISK
jgi:apolipoprotein N-acyltransferase